MFGFFNRNKKSKRVDTGRSGNSYPFGEAIDNAADAFVQVASVSNHNHNHKHTDYHSHDSYDSSDSGGDGGGGD